MADKNITELNTLFEEFKSAIARNDEVAQIRLNDAISEVEGKMKALEAASNRPEIKGDINNAEMKSFIDFARGQMSEAEFKAVNSAIDTGAGGGVTIPKQIEAQLHSLLVDISPIRSIARVVSVTTPNYTVPFGGAAASGWVAETASRSETTAPTITEVVVPFGEIYANALATQNIIDDSQFDIESFLANAVATEFARAEGAAFISGDGSNKPKGFLANAKAATADGARAFGTLQHVLSGQAGALPTNIDPFIAMTVALKAGFRKNAKWVMNKAVLGEVRKYKDATSGQYLWQPSLQAGTPSTFLGYEVVEAEDMPVVGASAYPVAFGDFNAGYTIADLVGVRTLRDPFSNKPYISLYTTKRVGGCVTDSNAIKLMKTNNS